ncbi:MAG: tripartite tricarboxylate transporter permease [Planctomycetota bacterium]|nr:tripartite tricarboxylate transporter permease [Planctomycetota bacterium]
MTPTTQAIELLTAPTGLILIAVGTGLGITVGAIPGLTGAMLIALTLPLTYSMDAGNAMILLVSMYVGSISGGLITATLLRMPGTPASIMTTLDGYPMARDGQAGRALTLSIMASFAGGIVSWLFLIALSKPMAELSTKFGPFEFFSLVMMALVLIASVGGKSLSAALFSGLLGILCAMPGVAEATGNVRMTFGFEELNGGLKLLPVLIGLFALSQVINDVLRIDDSIEQVPLSRQRLFPAWSDWKLHGFNMFRSSVIGTWIGILPGIGANIGSVAAYSTARTFSKTPERFGHGSEEGIIASESANNATVGGALIPLVAMGIPGSVIDAILLGALVLHGLQPGPLLFAQSPDLIYTIMGTYLISNFFMFVFLVLAVRQIARLTDVPRAFLIPVILTFCVVGSYALSNRMFDVWVMLIFGLVGFGLEKLRIPLAPFVIGFVLGPVAETNLCAGLMASGGNYLPLVTRPISAVFLVVSIILLVVPLIQRRKETKADVSLRQAEPVAEDVE